MYNKEVAVGADPHPQARNTTESHPQARNTTESHPQARNTTESHPQARNTTESTNLTKQLENINLSMMKGKSQKNCDLCGKAPYYSTDKLIKYTIVIRGRSITKYICDNCNKPDTREFKHGMECNSPAPMNNEIDTCGRCEECCRGSRNCSHERRSFCLACNKIIKNAAEAGHVIYRFMQCIDHEHERVCEKCGEMSIFPSQCKMCEKCHNSNTTY